MKIVGVTACPSGVAHTYMAAEALKKAAIAKGHEIKVETQGQIGLENEITQSEADAADVVVLKNTERFKGKPIVRIGISDLVKKAPALIEKIEEALQKRK